MSCTNCQCNESKTQAGQPAESHSSQPPKFSTIDFFTKLPYHLRANILSHTSSKDKLQLLSVLASSQLADSLLLKSSTVWSVIDIRVKEYASLEELFSMLDLAQKFLDISGGIRLSLDFSECETSHIRNYNAA